MMTKKLSSKPEIPTMKRESLSGFAVFEPQQSCFRNMSLCTHRKEHPNDFDLRLSASINTDDMDQHPTA